MMLSFPLSPFIYNFSDCVSDSHPSPLNLLFRKSRGDANLQCRLKFPSDLFACCIDCSRHTFQSRNQYTVCQRLNSSSVMLLLPWAILRWTYFVNNFLQKLLLICHPQLLAGD